jgi:hypothetical protein
MIVARQCRPEPAAQELELPDGNRIATIGVRSGRLRPKEEAQLRDRHGGKRAPARIRQASAPAL